MRERYGSPDVVEIRDVEIPTATGDQVLVRVQAASVNRADLDGLAPRPGFVRPFIGLRAPRERRMGIDAAGTVETVGANVTRFQPGDRVFADLFSYGGGAFAEFVAAPEKAFEPIPDGLSFEHAATLPHSAILAIQGLRLRDGRTVQPGDRVLIDGASGNVGPFAVQIAKWLGAEVTGVSRGDKVDFVRSLGADRVIDYTTTDYTRATERYDWILDTDSHHPLRHARRALRPGGVYVTLGGTSWPIVAALLLAPFISRASGTRMGLLLWWKPFDREDIRTITSLIQEGTLKPAIDRRFPLGEIVAALHYVGDGQARGKVIVTAGPS